MKKIYKSEYRIPSNRFRLRIINTGFNKYASKGQGLVDNKGLGMQSKTKDKIANCALISQDKELKIL